MSWPSGFGRLVVWLSGVIVLTSLLQVAGGSLNFWTSLLGVGLALLGMLWLMSGEKSDGLRPRVWLTVLALAAVASLCHLLLPSAKVEPAVLLTDVHVVAHGGDLVVHGTVERLGKATPVHLSVTASSARELVTVARQEHAFTAMLHLGLANPCSEVVMVSGPNQLTLSPLWCQQQGTVVR